MHRSGSRTKTRIGFRVLVFLAGACLAGSVQAQLIKCTDQNGKVYYGTTTPKECLGKPTTELSGQGNVKKQNEGILTPEQIAEREAARKKKIDDEKLAQEEKRKSQALLNTYSSEKDIEDARARTLKENEQAIKESEKRIADGNKRKKALDNEKEFYKNRALPQKLQEDITRNEIELRDQQGLLEAKKKQDVTINAKYDDDKRRYLQLTKGVATQSRK